jgi:hypothetical protein
MVVCLKHVGNTDSHRERLKMSVKTLASWSAHAQSTRPGNSSGPVTAESVNTQTSGTADALMHVSVLLALKRA